VTPPKSIFNVGAPGGEAAVQIQKFVLPYKLQVEQAQAGLTKSTADDLQVARDVAAYAKQQIDSGNLSGKARLAALQAEGQALGQLWAAQTEAASKSAAAAAKATAAAKAAAAKAAQEAATYSAPPALQVAQAKADYEAAAAGATTLTGQQRHVLEELKAAAEKAISSHVKTWQGIVAAYHDLTSIDQQLVQANTSGVASYHAASTIALTAGMGLGRDMRKQLEERLAQSAAHGGYLPNGPAASGVVIENAHFHGVNDMKKLSSELDKYARTHGRAGRR
jgi:hypothetical protein